MNPGGGIKMWNNIVLTNISIPLLKTVGYFTLDQLPLLVNFPVFARLQSIISLTIRNCPTLVTIPELLFPTVQVISIVTLDTLV